jgi:hypothetical protein
MYQAYPGPKTMSRKNKLWSHSNTEIPGLNAPIPVEAPCANESLENEYPVLEEEDRIMQVVFPATHIQATSTVSTRLAEAAH